MGSVTFSMQPEHNGDYTRHAYKEFIIQIF